MALKAERRTEVRPSEAILTFRVLAAPQIEQIHANALRILDEVGVLVDNREAVEVLAGAGARVEGSRVRLGPALVQAALDRAPRAVDLFSRDGARPIRLEGKRAHFGITGTAPYVFDPLTGERKWSTRETVGQVARLCEALAELDFMVVPGVPGDCPPSIVDRVAFVATISNQTRPTYSSANSVQGLADLIEMCEVIAGGADQLRSRPFFTTGIDPSSPLRYGSDVAGKLMLMAAKGLPLIVNPMTMAGATGPATLAGTLSLALAENLCGLALAQVVRPGTPVILGGGLGTMDMSTTVFAFGAPETALLSAAFADLVRSYGLPVFGTGGCSSANVVDEQSALEASYTLVLAALSGADLVHDVGEIDAAMTASMEQLVLANELIRLARHLLGGVEVNPETLAFDVIAQVGPGGNFLGEAHTLRHFRQHFRSSLLDRQRYEIWWDKGAQPLKARLSARVHHLLTTSAPAPLPAEVRRGLDEIVERAERLLT